MLVARRRPSDRRSGPSRRKLGRLREALSRGTAHHAVDTPGSTRFHTARPAAEQGRQWRLVAFGVQRMNSPVRRGTESASSVAARACGTRSRAVRAVLARRVVRVCAASTVPSRHVMAGTGSTSRRRLQRRRAMDRPERDCRFLSGSRANETSPKRHQRERQRRGLHRSHPFALLGTDGERCRRGSAGDLCARETGTGAAH